MPNKQSNLNDDRQLTISRLLDAPIELVWKAITDKNQMKKWYFDIPTFKPEVGLEFQFTGGPEEGPKYLHLCKITEVIPNKKLVHSWRYDGYPGNSFVTWELSEENGKTRVKLTHAGLSSFGTENPDFAESNFSQGWTAILGTSLPQFLEKNL